MSLWVTAAFELLPDFMGLSKTFVWLTRRHAGVKCAMMLVF